MKQWVTNVITSRKLWAILLHAIGWKKISDENNLVEIIMLEIGLKYICQNYNCLKI